MTRHAAFWIAALALAGCGADTDESPSGFACRYVNPGSELPECREYQGTGWTDATMEQDCDAVFTGTRGTVTPRRCDDQGSVGQCHVQLEAGREVTVYYYDEGEKKFDLKVGKNMCETYLKGTWSGPQSTEPDSLMDEALAAMRSNDEVKVTPECTEKNDTSCIKQLVERRRGIVFEPLGKTPEAGLVLYPGGNVDPRAYAVAAQALAAAGMLTVIVPMPGNLALSGYDRAADIVKAHGAAAKSWLLVGHSLGGAAAVQLVHENKTALDGLVLWAAYPGAEHTIKAHAIPVMSIFGTLDGVTTPAEIDASKKLLPADTQYVRLEGANHAQFGYYGSQAKDQAATISREHQHHLAVSATLYHARRVLAGGATLNPAFAKAPAAEKTWCVMAQQLVANIKSSALGDKISQTHFEDQTEYIKGKPTVTKSQAKVLSYIQQTGNPSYLGTLPVHSGEIWCKMKNQDEIAKQLGLAAEGPEGTCAAVNQAVVAWARDQVTEQERNAFDTSGPKLTFVADQEHASGPEWLEGKVELQATSDGYTLQSPRLRTDDDPAVPAEYRQMFYCKLWSPARALRWVLAFD